MEPVAPARLAGSSDEPWASRLVPYAVLALVAVLVCGFAGAVSITGAAVFEGSVERLYIFSLVVSVSFGTLSYVVWRHDPRNRIATIALAIAWVYAVALVLERYVLLGADRGWPGLEWMLWVSQWVWLPGLLMVPTVLALRFPDGQLPTSRWRSLEVLALVALAVQAVGFALTPYGVLAIPPPLGLDHPATFGGSLAIYYAGLVATLAAIVGCISGFVRRMTRARGTERAQLRWGLAGFVGSVSLVALSIQLGSGAAWLSLAGVTLLPASIAVAVVKHGLFDVPVAINRSLVYGSLSLAILAVYVVTVGLLGDALGRNVGAPLLATGIVAVGVEPARHRLQAWANQVVYGRTEDPYVVLSRVGERLTTTSDRTVLLSGAIDAVVHALRLRGAAILNDGTVLASAGDCHAPWNDVTLAADDEEVAVLRVAVHHDQQLSVRDERLLADLSHQLSVAVRAIRLQIELEASRARLIMAREEERKRIRQDLHDGLGPTLAAIGLEVERAGLEVGTRPAQAAARLEGVATRARETVRVVRNLVEGLRPASLDELGLDGAVKELVRGLGQDPVRFEVETVGPFETLPAAVSLAAYRIAGEAVTNVLRHAQASHCKLTLSVRPDRLHVLIQDDGVGMSNRSVGSGVGIGLRSMAGRAAELGGTLAVETRDEGGTQVAAQLPLEAS